MINLSAWDVHPAGYVNNKILMGGNLNEEKKSTQKVTGCTACGGYGSDGGGHVGALLLPHPPDLRQEALLPPEEPLLPMLLQLRLRLAPKRLSLTCTAMK